MHKSKI